MLELYKDYTRIIQGCQGFRGIAADEDGRSIYDIDKLQNIRIIL